MKKAFTILLSLFVLTACTAVDDSAVEDEVVEDEMTVDYADMEDEMTVDYADMDSALAEFSALLDEMQ